MMEEIKGHAVIQIYLDRDGYLTSSVKINNREKKFGFNDTKNLLSKLDEEAFDSVNLTNDAIRLKTDQAIVILYDLRELLQNNTFSLMPNTLPQIKEEIAKHNRRLAQNKKRENVKRGRRRIAVTAVAAVALVMLTATGFNLANNFSKDGANMFSSTVENGSINYSSVEELFNSIQSKSELDEISKELDDSDDLEVTISEAMTDNTVNNVNENIAHVDFKLTDDLEKKNYAYDNFHEIVEEAAQRFGMSPNLPMAMLTQESGGKEQNLMQIEFDQWKDMRLKAFNFETNSYDYFVLTDTPEEYKDTPYTTISRSDLLDPKINIEMGCVIIRKSAEMVDYHVLAGVQCYNLGVGNMETVLAETARNTGQDVRDILSDQTNTSFVEYTDIPGVGDKDYLSHVFQFLDEDGNVISFKHFDGEGNIITEEITVFGQDNKGLN